MKLLPPLRRLWRWLPPQTWTEVFIVLAVWLLCVLALAFIIDSLKGLLP